MGVLGGVGRDLLGESVPSALLPRLYPFERCIGTSALGSSTRTPLPVSLPVPSPTPVSVLSSLSRMVGPSPPTPVSGSSHWAYSTPSLSLFSKVLVWISPDSSVLFLSKTTLS